MPLSDPTGLLVRAADFAARRHKEQRRIGDGAPYVNHALSVAARLREVGGVDDAITLAAAMLHDTIEDTDTSRDDLAERFGAQVAHVVAEVSDDPSLDKAERKREQIRRAARLSPRARLVKLADKLDNLEDLRRTPPGRWNRQRIRGYFVWSFAVVAPLRGSNAALEAALDAAFAAPIAVGDGQPKRAVPDDDAERDALLAAYLDAMAAERP